MLMKRHTEETDPIIFFGFVAVEVMARVCVCRLFQLFLETRRFDYLTYV